ncbi:MAG: AAA family ATPase [Deltaproteobacteria bacterium]|nr:AAA family ATPase [Deltaproteobacteria bacterium]
MYTDFYDLKEKPFNLTPSSKYLYLGDIHKEALALLTYGVTERMGFILLTGEVGTGKTTMVHALLNSLGDDVQYVYLSNPLFSVNDFMDYLAFSAFKKKIHFQSKADFLIQFESFLQEKFQSHKNFILIIDEAQKLSVELLEEIRLLSNMETADEKLIKIFLIGQPELNDTLNRVECRPLLQRISVRYHIKPLDLKGTSDYILSRLKRAGSEDGSRIFSKNTIKAIHGFSGGYPRIINILADNALLLGYSRGLKKLTPEMIKECYNDLQLSNSPLGIQNSSEKENSLSRKNPDSTSASFWRKILFILLLIILAVISGILGMGIYSRLSHTLSENKIVSVNPLKKIPEQVPQKVNIASLDQDSGSLETAPDEGMKESISYAKIGNDSDINNEEEITEENINRQGIDVNTDIGASSDNSNIPKESNGRIITVKENETLAQLALAVYGYANERVLKLIKEYNHEIADINLIREGQVINFPSIDISSTNDQIYTVHIASLTLFEKADNLFYDLTRKGYEVYIMPAYDQDDKQVFRVTIGSFTDKSSAEGYAKELVDKGVSGYANVISLKAR